MLMMFLNFCFLKVVILGVKCEWVLLVMFSRCIWLVGRWGRKLLMEK